MPSKGSDFLPPPEEGGFTGSVAAAEASTPASVTLMAVLIAKSWNAVPFSSGGSVLTQLFQASIMSWSPDIVIVFV